MLKNKLSLIYWEITDSCNHHCIHCSNYWRNYDNPQVTVSPSTLTQNFMEIAHNIVAISPSKVILTGGEPLLVFDSIRPAIEFLLAQNIHISINTNCSLLTDKIAKYLREKRISLFISFPSYIPEEFDIIVNCKGAFARVSDGLKIAKKTISNSLLTLSFQK